MRTAGEKNVFLQDGRVGWPGGGGWWLVGVAGLSLSL